MSDDEAFVPFNRKEIVVDNRFNPYFPLISNVFTNINLEAGVQHWDFKHWNPNFGDISRYTMKSLLGSGRYSKVFLGFQDKTKAVAIKIIRDPNCDRVRRELHVLQKVQGHPNILKYVDIVMNQSLLPALITEVHPNTEWRSLLARMSLDDLRFYLYRIIQALFFCHSKGIMHRDVKPLNILCANPRESVILADWGLAEYYHPMHKYTPRVCTRYYKAPELLFDFGYYGYAVDMWSVGVILCEALSGKYHIFYSEDNEHHIESICALIGGEEVVEWLRRYHIRIGRKQKERILLMPKLPFESIIPSNRAVFRDRHALDLLRGLLTVDHKARTTAEEALLHPFFTLVREYDRNHTSQ